MRIPNTVNALFTAGALAATLTFTAGCSDQQAPVPSNFETADQTDGTTFAVYSTEPPAGPFGYENPQERVDALPHREIRSDHQGPATIESYTVMFGPEEPEIGHAACLLEDGCRTWANTRDAEALAAMTSEEFCGRPVEIDGQGNFTPR